MIINKSFRVNYYKLFSLILSIQLIAISCSINYVKAYTLSESVPPNALWIELSKTTILNPGDKFNSTVWINVSQVTYAWQTKIHFNTTYLNISAAGYTYGNRSFFFSEHLPISVSPIINHEEGFILCGESLLSNDKKSPGHGSLIWIEFELTDALFQTDLMLNISMVYGIDTFVLNPFLETIPFNTILGASIILHHETTSTTTTTTTATTTPPTTTATTTTPLISSELVILIVAISVGVVIVIILLRRGR